MLFFSTPPLHIGEYYTDDIPGLALFTSPKDSMLIRIEWFDSKRKGHMGYKDFIAAQPYFGPSAPDDSFHRLAWKVDDKTVSFEWSRTGGGAIARIKSTGPVKVIAWFAKAWPGSKPRITLNRWGDGLKFDGTELSLRSNGAFRMPDADADSGGIDWGEEVPITHVAYAITPDKPALLSIQSGGRAGDLDQVDQVIDQRADRYQNTRAKASGDWGDFLAPIQNQLGHSRVLSCDTGKISDIVSRGWCLPDGQVLFCWDSFFNGVLASIENPKAGREVVRAVLGGQQPSGLVPNFSGRGWGISADRSQPPVGSICVWKMYQMAPDKAFLREVYPKLLKWHRWWFKARDGNHDGLLEWGSETGVLQNAKFESGLDDSPMFDTGAMSGSDMTLDSVDLSSLWAADCEYLANIAAILGHRQEARELREQEEAISQRINELLWNLAVGNYCYRYWSPRQPVRPVSLAVESPEGSGFKADYFQGRDFDRLAASRQDAKIDFNWMGSPFAGLGATNFSVRWTGAWTPKDSASYIFKTYADDGVRLWVDGKKVIDDWKVHGTNESDSAPVLLASGQQHELKIEYFQAEGGATCRLEVDQIEKGPGETFYNRLSPLNFYPMMAGVPSRRQANQMLQMLLGAKFEAQYMCATIARDDPAFPLQGYWRGTIWGPTNYLLYQGLKRYASDSQLNEFAAKSVALFMKNWNSDGTCHENFSGITGVGGGDPHYTWGALLCLIGLENLCGFQPDGKLRLNGDSGVTVHISKLRLRGRLYDLHVRPREATLSLAGKVVYRAAGEAKEFRIR